MCQIEVVNEVEIARKVTMSSLWKAVETLEKKVIETCSNSEKSSNLSDKSKKYLRNLSKKRFIKEKKSGSRERMRILGKEVQL